MTVHSSYGRQIFKTFLHIEYTIPGHTSLISNLVFEKGRGTSSSYDTTFFSSLLLLTIHIDETQCITGSEIIQISMSLRLCASDFDI